MVIISGEIDLSVGSMVGFSGVLTAFFTKILHSAGIDISFSLCIAIVIALITAFFYWKIYLFLNHKI